jgi:Phage integrase, N-terminal SAM-like domain
VRFYNKEILFTLSLGLLSEKLIILRVFLSILIFCNRTVSLNNELPVTPPPDIEEIFIEFLGLDVADGNASIDTIANYKSQVKLYLQWCIDTSTNSLMATKKDIQEYRAYLVKQNYKPATIALKINVNMG